MSKHGTALQITPSIQREFHSAVIAQLPDLTDGEMQLYIQNKKELGRLLKGAFAADKKPAKIFPITCSGSYTTSELVKRGKYDWSADLITDERFPLQTHPPANKIIELMSFDHDLISEEVLAVFNYRGLELPSYEDALHFGIKYPNEQVKHPIVFLQYEVMFNLTSNRVVFVLNKDSRGRCLDLDLFTGDWGKHCVFAAVRKPD